MHEWIVGCGVRFWDQRELDQAIVMGYGVGVAFGLLGVALVIGGVMMFRDSEGWGERGLALLVAAMSLVAFLPAYMAFSDASCYSAI